MVLIEIYAFGVVVIVFNQHENSLSHYNSFVYGGCEAKFKRWYNRFQNGPKQCNIYPILKTDL